MNRIIFSIIALSLLISCGQANVSTQIDTNATPKEVLTALMDGNNRFINGGTNGANRNLNHVTKLNSGQQPQVAVIACSDSRVPVELLFDQGFGDVFVIRTAGNTALGKLSLGSVDYALNHLGVKVIMFLGHTNCGAITGVVQMGHGDHHIENDQEVAQMLGVIGESLEKHKGSGCNIDKAIVENAQNQAKVYASRAFVKEKIDKGELIVLPAIYDLATGKVNVDL